MIEESFRDFGKLCRSLEDQSQTARARIEVAKELTQSLEDQVVKILDDISQLEKEQASIKDHVTSVEAQLWKKKKKLSFKKTSNVTLKKKHNDALNWANRAEKRTELAKASALKALDDYKKLTTVEEEDTEASTVTYYYGFDDCKDKIAQLFPELDLSSIVIEEAAEEEEILQENAKEGQVEEASYLTLKEAPTEEAVYPILEEPSQVILASKDQV